MIKFLIKFASFLVCIGLLVFAGYKTVTENRIEEMIAELEDVFDSAFEAPNAPADPVNPDKPGDIIGGGSSDIIGGDVGNGDSPLSPDDSDYDVPDSSESESPTLSTSDARDAFTSFYDNSDPAFNDLNREFFTSMLSGIFGMFGGDSGSGSDTPPDEGGDNTNFDDVFNGDFGSGFDPDMEIEDDTDSSSGTTDYVVEIAGNYYDNLQAGIQAHQQANAHLSPEEQVAARDEFVARESEAFAGVVNVLTRADEATDDEIVQSVDAILNSTVCLNTVTESIQNDESISSNVQESTEGMNDETRDEIKAKLDAALLENPDNEEQYSYLADLFGITLGEN